ncbi:hypothetical protein [Hirschia baltica]|uniref:Uncharacterized protein n=1 Tax=Hirschia baltica (strain ATCC 49814 / DSM 5838 / IFAM 1418) TaxID=582402 RepID=C6XI26_HIRBI|nr:hypothetical protein [Hirschia baltica]ACT58852.1 hypothetical protein Hbal_1160 [Hirschia baltica ATCC 49814]
MPKNKKSNKEIRKPKKAKPKPNDGTPSKFGGTVLGIGSKKN